MVDLRAAAVVVSPTMTRRSEKAVTVLLEEAEKRSGIRWPVRTDDSVAASVMVYAALQQDWKTLGRRAAVFNVSPSRPGDEGYTIRAAQDGYGQWIAIC